MKINKPLLTSLLLYSLLTSCTSSNENIISFREKVAIIPETGILKLSDISKKYRIILLKDKNLSSIDNIYYKDSLFLVLGGSDNSSFHLFDHNGHFIKSPIKKGRGPKEALNIRKCRIYNNDVEFLIDHGTHILKYSLEHDSVLSKYPLPKEISAAADFIRLDAERIVLYKEFASGTKKEYKIYIYNDKNHEIEQRFLKLNPKTSEYISFTQMNNLYSHGNNIFFYEVFSPGIYQIEQDSITLHLYFDKKGYNFPQKLLNRDYRTLEEFITSCERNDYIWAHIDIAESNHHILSAFRYKTQPFLNIIYKDSLHSKSYTQIYDDLISDETYNIYIDGLNYITASQGFQYFTLEAYRFKEIMKTKKLQGDYKKFLEKFPKSATLDNSLQEDDNSIVIQLNM